MTIFPSDDILDIVKAVCSDEAETLLLHGTADHPFSGKKCLVYAVSSPAPSLAQF